MPESDALKDKHIRRLAESIRRGSCVLVLGPEAATNPDGNGSETLGSLLARRLVADRQAAGIETHAENDLALAAEFYVRSRNRDRLDLEIETRDLHRCYQGKTTSLHLELAKLPFRLCLTTTFDRFLETAFKSVGKHPVCSAYHFRDPACRTDVAIGDQQHPLIYSLFGDLEIDDSLVLSESDYEDFILTASRGSSSFHASVLNFLSREQTSFLFIGFGFRRWYTRMLLRLLRTQGTSTRSVALEHDGSFSEPGWGETGAYFSAAHSITFQENSWREIASQLRQQIDPEEGAKATEVTSPGADAPTVFLSYVREDAEKVEAIQRGLWRRGVGTWKDTRNLRGGEDWRRRIEHVINNVVDYVLVLESPNLVSQERSYVFREIREALERQKETPPGGVFLIPTTLAPNRGIEDLDGLNRADVVSEDGLDRLAQDIREDWTRRRTHRPGAAA